VAEAIAMSVAMMTSLRTPIVVVITGEGGSGGAIALAVGDTVIALENSIYSVISPEGCAAILWRSGEKSHQAAYAMQVTANQQKDLGVVDIVVAEPGEGAHTDPAEMARRIKEVVLEQFDLHASLSLTELVEARYQKFRGMGSFGLAEQPEAPPERTGLAGRIRGHAVHETVHASVPGNASSRPVQSRRGVGDARPRTGWQPEVCRGRCSTGQARPRRHRRSGRRSCCRP